MLGGCARKRRVSAPQTTRYTRKAAHRRLSYVRAKVCYSLPAAPCLARTRQPARAWPARRCRALLLIGELPAEPARAWPACRCRATRSPYVKTRSLPSAYPGQLLRLCCKGRLLAIGRLLLFCFDRIRDCQRCRTQATGVLGQWCFDQQAMVNRNKKGRTHKDSALRSSFF